MADEKVRFASLAENIRRKFKDEKAKKEKEGHKPATKSPADSGRDQIKKCPACNEEFEDWNLVVCPKDRTMLLTPTMRTATWFECAKKADEPLKRCPECNKLFANAYLHCRYDKVELESFDFRTLKAPVLEERYQLEAYQSTDKLFQTYSAKDLVENKMVSISFLTEVIPQDEKSLTHFLNLGRKAIGLKHPNLLTVYSVNISTDTSLDGTKNGIGVIPYLVSDFAVSKSLSAEIASRGFLDPASASRVFIDILAALSYAHENGIAHGAITTDNLRVTEEGGQLKGLLCNFGLAERLFKDLEWDKPSTNTHTANVYGDPDGICPEFCKGERPNPQTDLYQIGCSLYETLCGRPPFERPAVTQILLAHMMDEPDDIRMKNDKIPKHIVGIVLKCLKKDPKDRYASAQALSDDLQQFAKL